MRPMNTTDQASAATDALLLLLLDLEEARDPALGLPLAGLAKRLPAPLDRWADRDPGAVRTGLLGPGWITEQEVSLAGGDGLVRLTAAGRGRAGSLRALRQGPGRTREARRRVLAYVHHVHSAEGSPVDLTVLHGPRTPWVWVADRPLEVAEVQGAARTLLGRGLVEAAGPQTANNEIWYVRLTGDGERAIEEFGGDMQAWEQRRDVGRGATNYYGTVFQTTVGDQASGFAVGPDARVETGPVTNHRHTYTSVQDLARGCEEIIAAAPKLGLDEARTGEVVAAAEQARVELARDRPRGEVAIDLLERVQAIVEHENTRAALDMGHMVLVMIAAIGKLLLAG